MAEEGVDAMAAHLVTLTAEEMQDTVRIDAMTEALLASAFKVSEQYLRAGFPTAWVRAFVHAFHRTASARLAAYSHAARTGAVANDA